MTEVAEPTLTGLTPPRVRSVFGTWIAMVCTLRPRRLLTPSAVGSGIRWAWLNGRSPPRSKMLPRSTKNGSARWPANTCRPPPSGCTASSVNVSA